MNQRVAWVFPGQGSQSVGMMHVLAERFAAIQTLFQQASDILSYDLWDLVENGPIDQLNQTIYTQPAMLVADVAMCRVWQDMDTTQPVVLAGHSLGEYAAWVMADAIDFNDAVQLVSKRAHLMQNAVPEGVGTMAVVLGLSTEQVKAVCQAASALGVVEIANDNAAGQIVIAGETVAIEQAIVLAKEAGAKRARPLPISIPSHCSLMREMAKELRSYLDDVNIRAPRMPVINNVDVTVCDDPDDIRDALIRQLYCPVRWVETIQKMVEMSIESVVECGPGKVLKGLIKRIDAGLNTVALSETLLADYTKCKV